MRTMFLSYIKLMNNNRLIKIILIALISLNILYYYSNEVIISQNNNLVLYAGSKFETKSNNREIKILFYPYYNIQCKASIQQNKFNYFRIMESLSYKINVKNGFIVVDENCDYGYIGINNKQIAMDIARILSSILCILIICII